MLCEVNLVAGQVTRSTFFDQRQLGLGDNNHYFLRIESELIMSMMDLIWLLICLKVIPPPKNLK